MISYMSDDAFYYLVPAYAFAHGHGWTLDHRTRTAGFQFLYGYISAAVSLVSGNTKAFPISMAWVSAIALLFGLWITVTRARRLYGARIAVAATALTIVVPRALFQITAGLEWALAIVMTALFVAMLLRKENDPRSLAYVAIAAALVVLTRIDLAVFVAVFAVVAAWSRWMAGEITMKTAIRVCLAAAIGGAAAVTVTLVNAWAITATWIPNSVAIKAFWSQSNEFQPALSWNMIISCTGPGALLTRLSEVSGVRSRFAMSLFAIWLAVVCICEYRKGAERRTLALASALTILAYVALYARGVNVMFDHYSAGVIVPSALLLCGTLTSCGRRWPVLACVLVSGMTIIMVKDPWFTFPAHTVIANQSPRLFAQVQPGSHVAAWNAGIASWKNGGEITNLDGLANADVVRPIQNGTLACFLADWRIDYLMDFGFMFPAQIDATFSNNEEARRQLLITRGGYDPALLYRCTTLAATADDDLVAHTRYRLFKLDGGCVARLCEHKSGEIGATFDEPAPDRLAHHVGGQPGR